MGALRFHSWSLPGWLKRRPSYPLRSPIEVDERIVADSKTA
jgi:hypothetical protein